MTMVDLLGHGHSPRAHQYNLRVLLDALLEATEPRPDLLVGHSLGGVLALLAQSQLQPRRSILLDPAWRVTDERQSLEGEERLLPDAEEIATLNVEDIARQHPSWSSTDLEVELTSWRAWDPATLAVVEELRLSPQDLPPTCPGGSFVVVPDREPLVGPLLAGEFTGRGYQVLHVAQAGHVMHRDNLAGFLGVMAECVRDDGEEGEPTR